VVVAVLFLIFGYVAFTWPIMGDPHSNVEKVTFFEWFKKIVEGVTQDMSR